MFHIYFWEESAYTGMEFSMIMLHNITILFSSFLTLGQWWRFFPSSYLEQFIVVKKMIIENQWQDWMEKLLYVVILCQTTACIFVLIYLSLSITNNETFLLSNGHEHTFVSIFIFWVMSVGENLLAGVFIYGPICAEDEVEERGAVGGVIANSTLIGCINFLPCVGGMLLWLQNYNPILILDLEPAMHKHW